MKKRESKEKRERERDRDRDRQTETDRDRRRRRRGKIFERERERANRREEKRGREKTRNQNLSNTRSPTPRILFISVKDKCLRSGKVIIIWTVLYVSLAVPQSVGFKNASRSERYRLVSSRFTGSQQKNKKKFFKFILI